MEIPEIVFRLAWWWLAWVLSGMGRASHVSAEEPEEKTE